MIYQLNGPTKVSHVNGEKKQTKPDTSLLPEPFQTLTKTGGLEIQLQFVKGPVASFLHQNQLSRIRIQTNRASCYLQLKLNSKNFTAKFPQLYCQFITDCDTRHYVTRENNGPVQEETSPHIICTEGHHHHYHLLATLN